MTAVDERTVLDVNLDATAACVRCDCPATWFGTLRHELGAPCATTIYCDEHRRAFDQKVAEIRAAPFTEASCSTHLLPILVEWRPI